MTQLSEHISMREATFSATANRRGLLNYPDKLQLANMQLLAGKVFEPMRTFFDTPVYISSFFRCEQLNELIGGSKSSQHISGMAMDLDADVYNVITNKDIFNFIRENLVYDQLIWEFGNKDNPDWVHVSYNEGNNRRMVLKSYRTGRGTRYFNYE